MTGSRSIVRCVRGVDPESYTAALQAMLIEVMDSGPATITHLREGQDAAGLWGIYTFLDLMPSPPGETLPSPQMEAPSAIPDAPVRSPLTIDDELLELAGGGTESVACTYQVIRNGERYATGMSSLREAVKIASRDMLLDVGQPVAIIVSREKKFEFSSILRMQGMLSVE
jgi:hypothetical protein